MSNQLPRLGGSQSFVFGDSRESNPSLYIHFTLFRSLSLLVFLTTNDVSVQARG